MMSKRNSIRNGVKNITQSYIIGEVGNNHNGEMEKAFKMIDLAVEAGCNAIKFQKRHMPSVWTKEVLNKEFVSPWQNMPEEWGRTYGEIREAIELKIENFKELREYCRGKIDFGITPFDLTSLRQCDELDVDYFKVAGFSITDIPLLEELAKRGKPIIISCGMCTEKEIVDTLKALEGCPDIVLMHCVSSYPMGVEDANMRLITWLKRFGYSVGFSDHSTGISLGPIAVTLGAMFHEKHFTLDRTLPGFDHSFSLEPTGLKKWVRDIRKAEKALKGLSTHREVLPAEMKAFEEKRASVAAVRDIKKGEVITREMLTCKCPNIGLPPKQIPDIVGKIANENIPEDTHINFSMIKW